MQDDPLTATDSSPNNNSGEVKDATSTTGDIDGAANFDRGDYITFSSSSMDLEGTSYTFSYYIKFDDFSQRNGLFQKGDTREGRLHFINDDSNTIRHAWYYNDLSGTFSFSQSKRYHIVFKYNINTGEREIWVDGSKIASDITSEGTGLQPNSQTTAYLMYYEQDGIYANGKIDEFKAGTSYKSDS
jgi:hypothetical protein